MFPKPDFILTGTQIVLLKLIVAMKSILKPQNTQEGVYKQRTHTFTMLHTHARSIFTVGA